jgi:hypothetical protein
MSIRMLAGVGVAVIALTAVGSGAALALSGRDSSTGAPSAAQSSPKFGAQPQVGCLAWTIDGTVLSGAKQHEFVASGAKVVLYQEPAVDGQPGAYWALYPSTGVGSSAAKPPLSTWVRADSAAARKACAPFLAPTN